MSWESYINPQICVNYFQLGQVLWSLWHTFVTSSAFNFSSHCHMEDVIIRVMYRCWENASEKGSLIILSFEGIITFLGVRWLHKESASIKHFDSRAQGLVCRRQCHNPLCRLLSADLTTIHPVCFLPASLGIKQERV